MTLTDQPTLQPFTTVVHDLYRNIHKGIRSDLFTVTLTAGRIDPSDRVARVDLADHVGRVVALLELHAHHEDAVILPALELHLPDVAETIASDHIRLDARIAAVSDLAEVAAVAGKGAQRDLVHRVYVELAAFTSSYLAHQDCEERVVMPGLEQAVGVDTVIAMEQQIVGGIPPETMAKTLALMIPAMNVDDRTELLGGMKAGAPPEVFAGVWGLTGSVLAASDYAALGARLGLA